MTERDRLDVEQICRESGDEYLHHVLAENDRLRCNIAVLEAEKARAGAALKQALSELRRRDSIETSLRRRVE